MKIPWILLIPAAGLLFLLCSMPAEAAVCPGNCACLSAGMANSQGYTTFCGGKEIICGYEQTLKAQIPKYCYEKPVVTPTTPPIVKCPSGTTCLTVSDAAVKGFTASPLEKRPCGYDNLQNFKYCYIFPTAMTTATVTTTTPPAGTPDLVISDVYTEAWPAFHEFRYLIRNQGTGTAGPSATRLFIDGVQVGEDAVAGLSPGESRAESFSYSATCTGGADRFGATADITGTVAESDETNNNREREYSCPASVTLPDVALLDIWHEGERNYSYSTRAYTMPENIRFRIRSSNTSGALSTEARLFVDGAWTSTTTVTAATTREGGWEGQFGYTGICSGTSDTIRVVIDPSDTLVEQDETNNELSRTLDCRILPESDLRPDLVIRRFWMTPLGDFDYRIGYEVRNQGKEYTPFTETGLFIDGAYRVQDGVDRLGPDESRNEEFSWNYSLRECSGASDTLRLVADHDGRTAETDETNNGYDIPMNCTAIPATVTPKPDLVIDAAWYECALPCRVYNLTYTIRNRGTAAAGASVTGLNINYHDAGTGIAPGLAPGESATLTFPDPWTPEHPENHVLVCADRENDVDEISPAPSGELNNCNTTDWVIPPNCHDGIRNGGEVEADCGGPCTPCDKVAIVGRIVFEDMEWNWNVSRGLFPARRIKFQLLDDGGEITGLKTTNNDGSFAVVIPDTYRGRSLRIRIGDCTNFRAGFNYATKIAADVDGCNIYVTLTSNPFTVPASGDLYLGDRSVNATTAGDFRFSLDHRGYDSTYACNTLLPCEEESESRTGGSAYLSIADAALAGREYADEYRGGTDAIGKPTIQYPDEEWNMFYPPTYVIDIAGSKGPDSDYPHDDDTGWPDMGFSDGGVTHEYGHYLAYKISYLNPMGGYHRVCDKKLPEFAWNEGWAEYFGTIVPHTFQYSRSSPVGSLTDPDFDYADIETRLCGTEEGEDYEGNVAAVLWDLADDPATFNGSATESWDSVQDNEYLTFRVFDNEFGGATGHAYVPTLCRFVSYGWHSDDYDAVRHDDRAEIDALLSHMNVSCW